MEAFQIGQRVKVLTGVFVGREAEVVEVYDVFPGEIAMYVVIFPDRRVSVYYHNELEVSTWAKAS